MKSTTPVTALQRAIEIAGGTSSFASRLPTGANGLPISNARVWNWLHRDGRASAEVCPDIEAITGVACEELRPDVNWGQIRGKPAKRITSRPAARQSSTGIR